MEIRKIRDDILSKIREKLGKKSSRIITFVTNSNYQKYLIIKDDKTPVLNQQAIDEQAVRTAFLALLPM